MNGRQVGAAGGDGDESHAAEGGGGVAPVGRAIFLFDCMRGEGDPARIGVPGGAGEETAGGVVDPGIEILVADTGQIGIGPEEFIGDTGAVANHLAVFDGPSLKVLRAVEVGIEGDEGEGGDMGDPIGVFNLGGFEREQKLDGQLREEVRVVLAQVGVLREAGGEEVLASGIESARVAESAVFQ